MLTVLRLRLRRRAKANLLANRTSSESWESVITEFLAQIVSSYECKPEEFKDRLFSLVQMELRSRTTTWLELPVLAQLEETTSSLNQFATELERIEHDISTGRSQLAITYNCMM
jgi:hypothetical protein